MTTYNKLWVSLVGAVLLGLVGFLPDGHLDRIEGVQLVNMLAAVVLVGHIANTTWNVYAKGVAQAVAGSAPVLIAQLQDGWQLGQDLVPVLVAAAAAIGVIAVPNLRYPPLQGPGPRPVG